MRDGTSPSQDPGLFAEVALPVPLASTFTYSVPESLRDELFAGCRVEVPFGRRVLSGIVTSLKGHSDLKSIKPIRKRYETYLPRQLLRLTEWIASYYGCALGEAAQAVLPPLLKPALRKAPLSGVVTLAPDLDRAGIGKALSRARKQRELAELLAEQLHGLPVEVLVDRHGFATTHIKALVEKGFAIISQPRRTSTLDGMDGDVVELTGDQSASLQRIDKRIDEKAFAPMVLHGVTGSGKTELYLRAARRVLADGGGCIVLVPEIGLLPQAVGRYERVFGKDIAILHSRLTGAERYDIWRRIESGECRIVLGPRSAVFSPVRNLRMIVVDEEQDDSYKQDDKPRYHARNVALMRGKFEDLIVLLGSATPSAETMHQAREGRYDYLLLPSRVGAGALPRMSFVDMRESELGSAFFSNELLERLETNIEAGHQAILFLNKRGHARFVQCNACGWVARCENCDISLTYHRVSNRLRCHFCGFSRHSVEECDSCHGKKLYFAGVGTQRVELDLQGLFPGIQILRMDADTTSGKEGHRRVLEEFGTGNYPVLIGTQMVTKGHHFPGVSLVGVLFGEESLNYPDFRAGERTFQQLVQVAGRAGRGATAGDVIIQTYTPEHPVFQHLAAQDYNAFITEELKTRRELGYPPFSRLVLAACSSTRRDVLERVTAVWAERLRGLMAGKPVHVLGPAPPLIPRIKNRFRDQILLKGGITTVDKAAALASFEQVTASLPGGRNVDLRWDVDPEGFM